jgi:hypothetical protein
MMFYGTALLLQESPHQLYDVDRQGEAQRRATGLEMSATDLDFLPYPYPAIVALAFVPFTLLTYKTAYWLLMLMNLILLGSAVWLLSARLNLDRASNQVLVLCTTASISVYAALLQGQVSFIAFLFVVVVLANLRTGNDARAGAWAGCLAFKPTLLPIWLFWFVIRRRWSALAGALAVAGAMALISMVAVGFDGTLAYSNLSRRLIRGDFHTVLPTDMPTLRALTYFFGLSDALWLVAVAALLVVLSRMKESSDWEYGAVIVASILGAAHVHPQDLVVLLAAVGLLLVNIQDISRSTTWFFVGIILWQAVVRQLFAGPEGNHWPVLPITLIAVFTYLFYRGRSDEPVNVSRSF